MYIDIIKASLDVIKELFLFNHFHNILIGILIILSPLILYSLCKYLERIIIKNKKKKGCKKLLKLFTILVVWADCWLITAFLKDIPNNIYFNIYQFTDIIAYYVWYVAVTPLILFLFYIIIYKILTYLIYNIYLIIRDVVKLFNKENRKPKAIDVECEEVKSIVIPATRQFINKYKKVGTRREILTKYEKEYKELIKLETQQFINNKEICEHYFKLYTK